MKLLTGRTDRHTKWMFQAGELKECTEAVRNPARGWYQLHTFDIGEEPDLGELEWCIARDDTLAMVMICIGSCRDRDLSEEEVLRIRKILQFFADYRYDVILRAVYDREGKALEREPFFFSQVQRHMEQLGTLAGEFENTVFIWQGLLVGNWGEMHGSKFLSDGQLRTLAGILRERKGERTFLAVRKPVHWRMLHAGSELSDKAPADKMGLFDDGIFGSESDLGTFGDQTGAEAGWTNAWSPGEELAFEEKLCAFVPNGGEAVFSERYTDRLDVREMLLKLRRMHITYLNRFHDVRLLELWKRTRMSGGAWKDKSVYDYIGAHLGYRFLVRRVGVTSAGGYGGNLCRVDIDIENVGFANLYEEAELSLKWTNDMGRRETRLLPADMRRWDSGGTYRVCCTVGICESPLYLCAVRKSDKTPIYFANASEEDGRVMLGILQLKPNS